ncbi:MAG: NosD domain-containing protein, partial [Bacteroidota bacterium]
MNRLQLLWCVLLVPLWTMAQITVTSTADSGPGTLRQAVIDIPAGGTIDFNVGGPIVLTSGQIDLTKNMTLDATGPGVTIDGNGNSRIFGVYSSAVVNLLEVEMTNANAPAAFGGAIEISIGTLNASNCTFSNNIGGNGGAVSVAFGTGNFVNCNFINNTSTAQAGALDLNTNGNFSVINCLFYNNSSPSNGGAISIAFNANGPITNCTIADNSAGSNGGGIYHDPSAGAVDYNNNIIANNTNANAPDIFIGAAATASNNLITDYTGSGLTVGTNGNITGDPRFFNSAGGNYRLTDSSPAINAADASLLPTDILDVDGDGNSAETLDVDIDRTERLKVCAVDMGAFEHALTSLYVLNTDDSGPGSLRAAIECANADIFIDDIFFDIDGGGAHTINLSTQLPALSDDDVAVYGTSQPGYAGTPLISLDGAGSVSVGITASAAGNQILGLRIVNFVDNGISLSGSTNSNIFQCIATENDFAQIFIVGVQFATISQCLLNIDEDGTANSLDANAIWVQGSSRDLDIFENTMGGLNNVIDNIITILEPGSSFNRIADNFIGTNAAGDNYGTPTSGIYLQETSNNQLLRNTIANNATGILTDGAAQNNLFSQNNFICNQFNAINIGPGGNGNFPAPTITEPFLTMFSGTATPGAIVQVYLQDNSACPGAACQGTYLGEVTADGSGNWSGSAAGFNEGDIITALAYDPLNFNTSPLSSCAAIVPDPCDPDLDPPTITLLVNNITIECSDPLPPPLTPGFDIVAADGCDGDISTNIQLLGTTFDPQDCSGGGPVQIITNTYVVTDANNNSAQVDWVITQIDTSPPVFDDPSLSLTLNAECGDDIDALLAANLPTASDGCGLGTVTIVLVNSTSTALCGNTAQQNYVYEAVDDCGNVSAEQFTVSVTISDTTPPTFTTGPNQNITLSVDPGTCAAAVIGLSTTATDACGNVSITNDSPFATNPNEDASGLYPPGDYVITFTATDDCGNTEPYVVNLTVLQPDPPTFTGV